jgi:hypothetical protein
MYAAKLKYITSKAFLILPLSWLTEAERASGLIREATSPALRWFSNDQRDCGT